jgi:hypothetical protein
MIYSNIRILQVNLNRSQAATENTLQIAIELKIDIIIVQEPWITQYDSDDYSTARLVAYTSFTQILPKYSGFRPRTFIYMSRLFTPSTSIITSSLADPDVLIIDIIESKHKIQLLNIYNKQNQQPGDSMSTINRLFFNYTPYANSVLLGDFNTYYS